MVLKEANVLFCNERPFKQKLQIEYIDRKKLYRFVFLCSIKIEAHLDTLINEQASFVLTRAGLSQIYNCVQQHKPEQVRNGTSKAKTEQ